MKALVLTFVFNDWRSVAALLENLEREFATEDIAADVLIVDDGSTEGLPGSFGLTNSASIRSVEVLRLCRNMGHQRAIAIGLCHSHEHKEYDVAIVMDADGEDVPSDATRLLRHSIVRGSREIIFAARTRRSEGVLFKIFYKLYQALHWALTGKGIRVGNFSAIPRDLVCALVVDPNLWNHYAAAVANSRLPQSSIPAPRGKRLFGRSKLNFTALVIHGLSAIACYSEIIGVRVLLSSGVLAFIVLLGITAIVVIRFMTGLAIPGWATNAVGLLAVVLLQILSLAALFTLAVLASRKSRAVIPIQDYHYWVQSSRPL